MCRGEGVGIIAGDFVFIFGGFLFENIDAFLRLVEVWFVYSRIYLEFSYKLREIVKSGAEVE